MPGPAPPIVDGLQIDEALDFQRRFDRIQRVAWWLLALVPVAAVAGLFGGGLFSETTAGARAAGLAVTQDRFARRTAETELELELTRGAGPTEVAITRGFIDRYALVEARPEPLRVATLRDRIVFTFAARAGGRATLVLQPEAIGVARGTVTVTGGSAVGIRQLVYP